MAWVASKEEAFDISSCRVSRNRISFPGWSGAGDEERRLESRRGVMVETKRRPSPMRNPT
jgi:hypothetical protein